MATKRGPSKNLTKKMKQDIESAMSRAAERGLSSLDQAFQEQIQKHHLQADSNRFISAQRDALRKQAVSTSLKAINSANIPSDYKRAEIAAVTSAGFPGMSENQRMQMGEVSRKTAESLFRTQLRQTELSRNPFVQASQIKKLIESNEGDVGPNSRAMIDAKKKLASATDEASAISIRRQINSMEGSAASKIDVLRQMKTTESGDKTLKEIEKLLREQNKIISQDKNNFQNAMQQHPIVARLLGSDDPSGPGTMSAGRFGKIQNLSSMGTAMVQGAGAATEGYLAYRAARIGAEIETFSNISAIQAANANRAVSSFTDYSGKGLFSRYGDVLGGNTNRARGFLGRTGFKTSEDQAQKYIQEKKDLEFWGALKDSGVGLLTGAAGVAGGLALMKGAAVGTIASGGVAAIPAAAVGVAGWGLAGAGVMKVGESFSNLVGNRAIQGSALNIFSDELKTKAAASYAKEGADIGVSTRQSDLERNALTTSALDQALSYRESQLGNLYSAGSRAYSSQSFLRGVGSRFRTDIGNNDLEILNNRVQMMKSELLTSDNPMSRLGVDASAFDRMATMAGLSMGPGYRGGQKGQATTAVLAEELARSGRGSFEQILGNISALNRVTGLSDSSQQLEKIMSKAVGLGFDNSKLAQEFVGRATEITAGVGATDANRMVELLARASAMAGGGERGLQMGEKGAKELNAFVDSNVRAKAISRKALGDAMASLNMGQNDPRSSYAASFADLFSDLNTTEQGELLSGSKDPKYKVLNDLLAQMNAGPDSEFLKILKTGREKTLFGSADPRKVLQRAKEALKEKGGRAKASQIINTDLIAVMAQQVGMTSDSARMALSEFINQNKGQFGDLAPVMSGSAKDQSAIARFNSLNKFNALSAAGRNAMTSFGEASLSGTLMADLMDKFSKNPKTSSVGALLSAGSTLGTGIRSEKIETMIGTDQRRKILQELSSDRFKKDEERLKFAEQKKGEFGADVSAADMVSLSKALLQEKETAIFTEEQRKKEAWGNVGIQTVRIASESIRELAFGIAGEGKAVKGLEAYNLSNRRPGMN